MRRAIALAKKGRGYTSPNPLVGAVIVKDDVIIGEGYHQHYGGLHAEREAIQSLTRDAHGATMYVTLEPCCHQGKQPPCTQAILSAGISTVVIGSRDPNPLVAGGGVAFLKAHGIQVVEDYLKEECDALNPIFFHYITSHLPYVALKYAMTADGKIALENGDSQWITQPKSRAHVHLLRQQYRSILVGIETVLTDNPTLTCRLPFSDVHVIQPIRIVLDSNLRIPLTSQLVQTIDEAPLIVVTTPEGAKAQAAKRQVLTAAGVEVLEFQRHPATGHIDLFPLLQELGRRHVDSLLVEGGGQVHASFLQQHQAQKLYVYIGAKLFGGGSSKDPVGALPIASVSHAIQLSHPKIHSWGDQCVDVLLEYDLLSKEVS
ncbi:MAG: bifunctional diaminohydroxyphosphoribosylaminopyrimidine deaminase/5-amino-6-(5-phosphoribosylamino)uracil reductase RibD [Lachnospiraceae bacterium]|nr:bifunctional diaminohydroxyphosphoribosylaminopyrimidine deaminase/5-amino-6-(5-phosphoribosylamino)uracil reductase RibD [Lachnospiraceae bacterium]